MVLVTRHVSPDPVRYAPAPGSTLALQLWPDVHFRSSLRSPSSRGILVKTDQQLGTWITHPPSCLDLSRDAIFTVR